MSAVSVVRCPGCSTEIAEDVVLGDSPRVCSGCGKQLQVWLAAGRGLKADAVSIAPAIAGEEEARCRFLPELRAEEVCESCGAMMSGAASARWGEKVLCLPCVSRSQREEGGDLSVGGVIFDNVALLLVTLLAPLSLLTAPVAMYLLIRYRRAPRGFVPRGPVRWWLAMLLSLVSLIIWVGLLGLGISMMLDSLRM